MLAHHKRC